MIWWVGAVAAFYFLYKKNAPTISQSAAAIEPPATVAGSGDGGDGDGEGTREGDRKVTILPAPPNPFRSDDGKKPEGFRGSYDDLMPEPAPEDADNDYEDDQVDADADDVVEEEGEET